MYNNALMAVRARYDALLERQRWEYGYGYGYQPSDPAQGYEADGQSAGEDGQ